MRTQDTTPPEIAAFSDYLTISRNKAKKTAYQYSRDIQRFSRFIAPAELQSATTEQIEEWKISLLKEGRNQPQSVLRKIAALASFYKWLKRRKVRLDNPADDVEKPAVAKRLPKVMSEDEVLAVLAVVPAHKRLATWLNVRDRAMMELLYGSGLRRFEACGLDLADIDLEKRRVRVRNGKGRKERYSFLSGPTVDVLREYLAVRPQVDEHALFLSARRLRLSPRGLWSVFRSFADNAGLQKHVVPHTMRHSFATHLYRHSRDLRAVQRMMGHSNINTTTIYTHIEDDELQDVYLKSHPRAS